MKVRISEEEQMCSGRRRGPLQHGGGWQIRGRNRNFCLSSLYFQCLLYPMLLVTVVYNSVKLLGVQYGKFSQM